MKQACPSCGQPLEDGLCPTCDVTEQIDVDVEVDLEAEEVDPLLGKVLADRYQILSLHGTGGMARVYRAVQRSLEREVVVKVINPELLAADETTADEAVARFFVEAQAASKLNHPNVVSVFDFGRTSAADGGLLFLVMEYLTGRDLWTVHHEEPGMPIPRVANILQQTLAALGEAHYLGIAHRDIKPENIILEPTRSGRDHVKVIDFGLAKLNRQKSVTRIGQTVGTPSYMAPEQIAGKAVGSADLYAVGVILFELLTGKLPFEGNPLQVLRKHLDAPRPDPRDVAPDRDIPAALASVCMRAMHVDPDQRWPDAESLAEAIVRAAGTADWSSRASFSSFSSASGRVTVPASQPFSMPPPGRSTAPVPDRARQAPSSAPLLGRDADLAWATRILASRRGGCLAIHGAPGTGRSRLLREIASGAERRGTRVVRVRGPASPHREATHAVLRTMIAALAGLGADDPRLASGEAAEHDAAASAGLLAVFGGLFQSPKETRASAAAAFAWAAGQAAERAGAAPTLLTIDDADQLDTASLNAVAEGLASVAAPGFFVATTSLSALALPPDRTSEREIGGLPLADAARLLDALGGGRDGPLSRREDGPVEPLYVEILRRWKLDGAQSRAPARLLDLVEMVLLALPPPQRRLLLVAAIHGACSRAELAALARRDDEDRARGPLVEAGILEVSPEEGVRVAHEIFAQVAIGLAPVGAVEELHAAMADRLADDPARSELRAYHALLGRPDFETFMLVEDAAALRTAAGDDQGAVDMLASALRAGRALLRHGDVEAGGSACVVFGQKLGALLRELGRADEAVAVLAEALETTGPEDAGRIRILEELARAAGSLGQRADSERWRREALSIARKRDDRAAVQRLVALARE